MPQWWKSPRARRIASAIFLALLLLLAARTCTQESANGKIFVELGDPGVEIKAIEIEILDEKAGDVLGAFRRSDARGVHRFELDAPKTAGDYVLRIALTCGGEAKVFRRVLRIDPAASVTVNLSRELAECTGVTRG